MASSARAPQAEVAVTRRFLTFRLLQRLYALPAQDVAEVIHVPELARIPQGPPGLLGLGNLRGVVLPVASLYGLLGRAGASTGPGARAIVLNGETPAAIAVDQVVSLASVAASEVESRQVELAAEAGERLIGAFQAGDEVAHILDLPRLLAASSPSKPMVLFSSGASSSNSMRITDCRRRRLVASFRVILLSQVLNFESARNEARFRKARTNASCATSSASASFFTYDKASRYTLRSWGRISSW